MCISMHKYIFNMLNLFCCCFHVLGLTTLYRINDKQAHPRKGLILPLYFSTVIVHILGVGPCEIFHIHVRMSIHNANILDYAIIYMRDCFSARFLLFCLLQCSVPWTMNFRCKKSE